MSDKIEDFRADNVSVAEMSAEEVDAYLDSLKTPRQNADETTGSEKQADTPQPAAENDINQSASRDPLDDELAGLESLLAEAQGLEEQSAPQTNASGNPSPSAQPQSMISGDAENDEENPTETDASETDINTEPDTGSRKSHDAQDPPLPDNRQEEVSCETSFTETPDEQATEDRSTAEEKIGSEVEKENNEQSPVVRKSFLNNWLGRFSILFHCLAVLVVQLLLVLDRPFARFSMQTKTIAGYLGLATLFVALMTWIFNTII